MGQKSSDEHLPFTVVSNIEFTLFKTIPADIPFTKRNSQTYDRQKGIGHS